MQHGRMALLALSLLSACAATDPGADALPASGRRPAGLFTDYLVGRYAAARGDIGTAAERLRAAAALDPNDPALTLQAFLTNLLAGKPEAERLAARVPSNPLARLLLADKEARAGRWVAAQARYAALPQESITGALQPLLIAWAQQGQGQTRAALGTLAAVAQRSPLRSVYTLHMALIADQAGRAGDAARLYQQARADYGTLNLRLGVILASAEARRGLAADARRTIAALVAQNPDLGIAQAALDAAVMRPVVPRPIDGIAEAYLAFAAALRDQGASQLAEALLHLALLDRPDFAAARLLLAEIEDRGKQPRSALVTLDHIRSSDPLYAVARLREVGVLDTLGQHARAAALAAKLAQDFPARPEPLAREGDVLRIEKHFHKAAAAYSAAIERARALGPISWTLYFERGVSREQAGDWPGAQADLEQALQLAPEQPVVLNFLAYSWAERNQHLARARQMLERAVAISPNDGSIVDSLGWAMLRQGDVKDALAQLERAVELEPEDPVINAHLGDAYLAAGRRREAEYQWRRALTLKPDGADKARIEAKLSTIAADAATGLASTPAHARP